MVPPEVMIMMINIFKILISLIKMKTRLEPTGLPTPLEAVVDVELSLEGSSTEELCAGILYIF